MPERKPADALAGAMPPAPTPDPTAREQAIERALARFDARHGRYGFGGEAHSKRDRQGRFRTFAMNGSRAAIAAAAVIVVAGPIAWKIAQERQAEPMVETPQVPAPSPAPIVAPPALAGQGAPPAEVPLGRPQAISPQPAPVEKAETLAAAVAPQPAPPPPTAHAAPAPAITARSAPAPEAEMRAKAMAQRPVLPTLAAPPSPAAPSPAPAAKAKKPAEPTQATRLEEALRPSPRLTRSLPQASIADARARRDAAPTASRIVAPSTRQLSLAPEPGIAPEPGVADAEEAGRDRFDGRPQSGFAPVREAPVSTFSIDVDTASYGFLRAALNRNVLPQPDAVRVEELINYFPYAYPAPTRAETPFRVTASVFPSPWAEGRKLLRIGIKGYALEQAHRPRANLVFLIDTSGSMSGPNRLPLVKQALALLLASLDAKDRVAIVTYAGSAGTVLEPTPASEKGKILAAIEGLEAGGGTAGGEGIRQAYALAARGYDPAAVNRVMLLTDGDFNIGITSREALKGFVEREREKGIFLSVLGFGMGNHNDALMQALAQNGNGAAAYIDTLNEARKALVEEASATLFPIAKDVKIQVEFNPATVSEYRLIGYETRLLAREDFQNDRVDAGEVGSGQTATALYEIVPRGGPRTVSDLRYGEPEKAPPADDAAAGEVAFVKLRYKLPEEEASRLIETPVGPQAERASLGEADEDARFATAVAGFGEILRGGRWTGRFGLDDILKLASAARGDDPYGYRSEFLQLVRAAKTAQALQAARP